MSIYASGDQVRGALYGIFGSEPTDSTDQAYIGMIQQKQLAYPKAADAAANSTMTETIIARNPLGVSARIVALKMSASANVTSDNTTYASLVFKHYTAAGASGTTIATANTSNSGATNGIGNLTLMVPYTVTLTDGSEIIPANGCVTLTQAKASTGVQLPAMQIDLVVQPA